MMDHVQKGFNKTYFICILAIKTFKLWGWCNMVENHEVIMHAARTK